MMKKYAAILFDIDGTLVDLDAVIEGIKKAIEKNGFGKITEEEVAKKIIGYKLVEILPKILEISEEEAERVSRDYTQYYLEHHRESDPYPPVKETLRELREKGFKIGLVTTKKRSEALSTLETYPEIIYDVLVAGDDVENVKPNPEPVEKACEELGIMEKEALYVGDHAVDVEVGRNAGCDTVAVTTGVHDRKELEEAGAETIIDNLKEILSIALTEAEEITEVIKVPKDRLGAIIGKKGEVKKLLEKLTDVKLDIDSKKSEVACTRYIGRGSEKAIKASDVVKAISLGFSPRKAFKLLEPNKYIEIIDIRDYVGKSKSEIKRVKSRIIGKQGKARENIQRLTDTKISVKNDKVAIIGEIKGVNSAKLGVEKLIEGTPHSLVYKKLEKQRKKPYF